MLIKPLIAGVVVALALTPLTTIAGKHGDLKQKGAASYYADRFHGRKTASGERYNKQALTAAHRTLPLGTRVRVTNAKNGKSVVVKINDRGPFGKGRILDLSREAAEELRMIRSGVARVQLEVLSSEGDT